MTVRLRPVSITVTINAFADDGNELVPLEVAPVVVPLAQWEAFLASGFMHAVEQLRQQVEGPALQAVEDVPDTAEAT